MKRYCIDEVISSRVTYMSPPVQVEVEIYDTITDTTDRKRMSEQEAVRVGFTLPLFEGQVIEVVSGIAVDTTESARLRAKALYVRLLEREGRR